MILEDYEVFCPKCTGTGKGQTWMAGEFEITPECRHCLGDGKLDWIERITGKPPRIYDMHYQEIVEEMGKEIAEEIDKEIIESVIEAADHVKEQNKKEGQNDNRVFPKLLFHSIAK
jgi:DnaJ-class molecular chaperone